MTELKPCPFCGGEADEYEGDYGNGIYCMMCGAMVGEPIHMGYRTTKRVSIAEAIAVWNSRTAELLPELRKEGEAISISSSQANELRTLADKLRDVRLDDKANYAESVETMFRAMGAMREAADTIESMMGRLQAAELNSRSERTCKVEVRESALGGYTRHCGNCGADLDCDTRNKQNHCPNCGAKVTG